MIAEVVPYTRTLRGNDVFDYAIPTELSVSVGDVVLIPFRNKKIWGVVWNVKHTSDVKQLKLLRSVLPQKKWSSAQRKSLEWFARYYYISLPHALKTVAQPVLKRARAVTLPVEKYGLKAAHEISIPVSQVSVVKKGIKQTLKSKSSVVLYNHNTDRLASYRAVASLSRSHVLYIVAEYHDMKALIPAFRGFEVITLESDPSPSLWKALVQRLQQKEKLIIIGTKRSVFLPLEYFSTVVVDQEEAKGHKQYQLNPRYHVRTVLLEQSQVYQRASASFPSLLFFSAAPSFDVFTLVEQGKMKQVDLRRRLSYSHVHIISMTDEQKRQNYSWFSEELIERLQHAKKPLLLFNRTGEYGVAICRDCFSVLPIATSRCTGCNGMNIKKSRKGTQALEKELRLLFPGKNILRIDRDQDTNILTPEAVKKADLLIGTEKMLRIVDLNIIDLIGVLSVDHLLVYPHFQAHERVYQFLSRLLVMHIPLFIQTHSPEHVVIRAAAMNNYERFARYELALRKTLKLPPYGIYAQLIHRKTRHVKTRRFKLPEQSLSTDVIVDRY